MDMKQLAQDITNDSEAIRRRREELPETKRPKDISGMKNLRKEIEFYKNRNDKYQETIDTLRHLNNGYERGKLLSHKGDELVRPAWEAKTNPTKQPPWPFDTNFKELIKIFHHCYAPVLKQLQSDLERVARKIEQGMALLPSERQMKLIRSDVSKIASDFHWLQENWRVHYLQQIDSSEKKDFSFQEVPPGIPNIMRDVEQQLLSVTNRLKELNDSFRGEKSLGISKSQLVWGIIGVLLTVFTLVLAQITGLIDLIKGT